MSQKKRYSFKTTSINFEHFNHIYHSYFDNTVFKKHLEYWISKLIFGKNPVTRIELLDLLN